MMYENYYESYMMMTGYMREKQVTETRQAPLGSQSLPLGDHGHFLEKAMSKVCALSSMDAPGEDGCHN
jgi:hypothetical protein